MNRNHNKSSVVTTLVVLLVCLVLVTGSTFSLFTSDSKVNIAVTAGDVELTATIDTSSLALYSKGEAQTGKFANGGTAAFNDKNTELTLTNITPGDSVVFNIVVENESTVDLQYRVNWIVSGELAEVLEATVNGADITSGTSEWTLWKADDTTKSQTLELAIELPLEADDNWEELAANIAFNVEAVQANATGEYSPKAFVNTAAGLQAAIDSGATEITLNEDIELDGTIIIPAAPTTFSIVATGVSFDLNGKTISANHNKSEGAVIENNGVLTLKNGTVSSLGNNGGSALVNKGIATLENVTLNGAPNEGEGWPSYAVNNTGSLTISDSYITSVHGAVCSYGEGAVITLNNTDIDMAGIDNFTSHGIYTYNSGVVYVNGGDIANHNATQNASGASVINGNVIISAGNFTGRIENYYGTPVISGGSFSENPGRFLADGYEATETDGVYSVAFPQKSVESLLDNAAAGDTVEIPAGNFTFPTSDIKEGMTLNCAPGTVFEGTSTLNINGATVVGGTFSNTNGTVATSTINGTFKDCTFSGYNGLRWCYAGENVVFENCVFDGDVYGVHFDGGANEVIFRNCTFSGFNAFGGEITTLVLEGCTFKANGKSNYNGANLWGSTTLTDCTFIFDGQAGYEWVDAMGSNETYSFTNCVVVDAEGNKAGVETVAGNYGAGNVITIDGVRFASSNDDLKAAVAAGATKVLLADGEYDLNGNQKGGLTLVGVGENVKVANTTKYAGGKSTGAIWQAINLENVTITNTVYTMADGGKATFTNVTFAAGFRQGYGTGVVFTDCTFGSNADGYALHFQTDSASEGGLITLNGCEFEGGKVHLGGKRAYEFVGCDFAAGTDFQIWSNITLNGCTVDGEAVTADNIATLFPNLNLEKVTLK